MVQSVRAFANFLLDDPATAVIYTLSLHDALPICHPCAGRRWHRSALDQGFDPHSAQWVRSEEHTSELQSRGHLVCRLLLEKKNPDRRARIRILRLKENLLQLDVENPSKLQLFWSI